MTRALGLSWGSVVIRDLLSSSSVPRTFERRDVGRLKRIRRRAGGRYHASRGKLANGRRSHQPDPLFCFWAKPELPEQPSIRGERQRDRVAPRRYAADQMQGCHQDHRGGGNRLRLEGPAGGGGVVLVV